MSDVPPRDPVGPRRYKPESPIQLRIIVERAARGRRNRRGEAGLVVPVEPDRPNSLSGGAAAVPDEA